MVTIMEIMKINTLNEDAKNRFRKNLTETQVEFKQLGTAFLIPEHTGTFYPKAFDGLWTGVDANIEIQKLNPDFDLHQELYVH